MTLQELYAQIDGDYDHATRVLRVDKLIAKHIRKLPQNGVVDALLEAGRENDPGKMFETAHAMKGLCANLGLLRLSDLASDIAEEYRPGNSRTLTDEEVDVKLQEIADLYTRTVDAIHQYEEACG